MKNAITKPLSKLILTGIEPKEIIYAEVTPQGAMGNSGGIIIYIPESGTDQLICYEVNITYDQETYLLAEDILFKHLDKQNSGNANKNLYFDIYDGRMGNIVFINKKVKLEVKENYFIYRSEQSQFQLFSSVQGVFMGVASEIQKRKNDTQ